MPLVTGPEVLILAGTPRPTPDQSAWADMAAAAISAAVEQYLAAYPVAFRVAPPVWRGPGLTERNPRYPLTWADAWARDITPDTPGYAEVQPAAQLAALELYKRREAPFGATSYADAYGQAIRLSRDYLAPILPTLRRWHATAGVVAS